MFVSNPYLLRQTGVKDSNEGSDCGREDYRNPTAKPDGAGMISQYEKCSDGDTDTPCESEQGNFQQI